jgi:hypothetical protein
MRPLSRPQWHQCSRTSHLPTTADKLSLSSTGPGPFHQSTGSVFTPSPTAASPFLRLQDYAAERLTHHSKDTCRLFNSLSRQIYNSPNNLPYRLIIIGQWSSDRKLFVLYDPTSLAPCVIPEGSSRLHLSHHLTLTRQRQPLTLHKYCTGCMNHLEFQYGYYPAETTPCTPSTLGKNGKHHMRNVEMHISLRHRILLGHKM